MKGGSDTKVSPTLVRFYIRLKTPHQRLLSITDSTTCYSFNSTTH